ncbi:MAG: chemotaxis protein CheR [Lentisphaerae bacterium GWF2_52_8]|nr:MAG: chemotaxis protein CheR [Lentisphaerae bacterium GWF2_52_8]
MEKAVFNELRRIVYEKSGISLGDNKEALVASRISKRLRALNLPSHSAYLNYLMSDNGEELVQMLDVISTNTTNFFRESPHFDFLDDVMKKWLAAGQRRFRIWCAASSSGEEPYSLAMSMLEAAKGDSLDLKILATDISTKVLKFAHMGIYPKDRVKEIPASLLHKYFIKHKEAGETYYEASPLLKDVISFRRLNLSNPPFPMKGPMDFVFCRNVMIYFDHAVRQPLIDECFRLLKPGGYFMVGHSESLAGISTKFKTVKPATYIKPS